jgi:hypothetical protein
VTTDDYLLAASGHSVDPSGATGTQPPTSGGAASQARRTTACTCIPAACLSDDHQRDRDLAGRGHPQIRPSQRRLRGRPGSVVGGFPTSSRTMSIAELPGCEARLPDRALERSGYWSWPQMPAENAGTVPPASHNHTPQGLTGTAHLTFPAVPFPVSGSSRRLAGCHVPARLAPPHAGRGVVTGGATIFLADSLARAQAPDLVIVAHHPSRRKASLT